MGEGDRLELAYKLEGKLPPPLVRGAVLADKEEAARLSETRTIVGN